MKKQKLILLATVITLITSCTNSKTGSTEKLTSDSLKSPADSAKNNLALKDQNKVLGDINFGINNKLFNKELNQFKKNSHPIKSGTLFSIGDYRYAAIHGFFDNDKLYSVLVSGDFIHYENYETELIAQTDALKLILQKKYGTPSESVGPPQWHETEKGYTYLAYRWIIGSKTIEIRISNDGLYFAVQLYIYQPKVVEMIKSKEEKNNLDHAEKAKDVL